MMPLGWFGSLGLPEILLILLIVVFLFGARRIPEIARGLGEGIRGFRTASWIEVDIRRIDFTGAHLCRRFILDQNYLEVYRAAGQ